MRLDAVIYVIGATGVFPSRAFMPAFVTALVLRFGHLIPYVGNRDWLQAVEGVPVWFAHDATLWVLGILSVVELCATKNSDIRSFLDEFDTIVKSIVSLLVSFGVLNAADADIVHNTMGMSVGEGSLAVGCAGGVCFLSGLRYQVYELLSQLDPDGSLGIQRLAAWLEDSWVIGALILLIVFPIVMLLLSAVVFLCLYAVRQHLERMEVSTRFACSGCATQIFPSAMVCHKCQRQVDKPCGVGFFGQSKPTVPANIVEHPFRLIEYSRCPACASRLLPDHECGACGLRVFDDQSMTEAYIKFIDRRRRTVIPICFALSLLPVVGVVPAIVYYRITLVAPYQRHIARTRRIVTRWLSRIANFGILTFQWVPIVGGIALPLMAVTSHLVNRSAFRSGLEVSRTGRAVPADRPTTKDG